MRNRRVLVVEDERPLRQYIATALTSYGYTTYTASQGTEAFQLIENADGLIDLLLTDISMPGITGPVLAERVRSRFPKIRILFMSGSPSETLARYNLGPAELLSKPFGVHELLRFVGQDDAQQDGPSPGCHEATAAAASSGPVANRILSR